MNKIESSQIIKFFFPLKKLIMLSALSIIITLIITSCARPMAPTGGPKDENPPVALKSKPINYSTNFNDDKIIIEFDEFVVLKNLKQELLVSPPLEEQPIVKLRGKKILIKMESERKDSTTYGINFYEALADLNEGNILKNFQFEFSTGSVFDSLYVGGNLKNAFNYTTEKGIYIMLYKVFNDSTPRKQLPEYIAKTDEEGNFFITNMKNEPYYIFALQDLNNNMLFDLPNEALAFLDRTFLPKYKEIEVVDTIHYIDSISVSLQDTVFADSIHRYKEMVTTIGDIQLFMFHENFEQQYFNLEYRQVREQVIFAFNKKLNDSVSVFPIIDTVFNPNWYIQETHVTNDSLVYWIKDSVIFNTDSLHFQVNYTMKDSNSQNYIKTDTLLLLFADSEVKVSESVKNGKKKKERKFSIGKLINNNEKGEVKDTIIPSELTFVSNAKTPFELNANVSLVSRFPILNINETLIEFVKIEDDTVETPIEYSFFKDSLFIREFHVSFEKKEEEKFKLLIPAGCFTDIYGNINDTLKYVFTTRALDHYGTIKTKIINLKENSVIQLLDEKENILEEKSINTDSTLLYEYLQPAKYVLKLFYDINRNKIWDTGNYKALKQPEQVFYFSQELDVKSNFDYEYEWDLYPVVNESTIMDSLPIIPEITTPFNKPNKE